LAVTTETLLGVATPWIALDPPLELLLLLLAPAPLLLLVLLPIDEPPPAAAAFAESLELPHPAIRAVIAVTPRIPQVLNRSLLNFMSISSSAARCSTPAAKS
jgi:hypothetical protein